MAVVDHEFLAMAGPPGGGCRVSHELLQVVSVECVPGACGLRAGLLCWWVFRVLIRGLILQWSPAAAITVVIRAGQTELEIWVDIRYSWFGCASSFLGGATPLYLSPCNARMALMRTLTTEAHKRLYLYAHPRRCARGLHSYR